MEAQDKATITESIEISDDSSDGSVDAIKNLALLGDVPNTQTKETSPEQLSSKQLFQPEDYQNKIEDLDQTKNNDQLDDEKPEGKFMCLLTC